VFKSWEGTWKPQTNSGSERRKERRQGNEAKRIGKGDMGSED